MAVLVLAASAAVASPDLFRTPTTSPAGGVGAVTSPLQDPSDPAYDGRFTFVRIRFRGPGAGLPGMGFRRRQPMWAHDYPRAEQNFAEILGETTTLRNVREGAAGRVLELTDPELFKYPVAYIVEVGYWRPDEAEAAALREYLLKGGFLIVDDFRGRDLLVFQDAMRRILPGLEIRPVEAGHRIFDSFFHIEEPTSLAPPTFPQYPPTYLGIYEDNDPEGRLMVMLNYNNDIAEYWEYSDMGYLPIDLSNQAYKFGVNYIIYAMTH
jgi:hypothetical protein